MTSIKYSTTWVMFDWRISIWTFGFLLSKEHSLLIHLGQKYLVICFWVVWNIFIKWPFSFLKCNLTERIERDTITITGAILEIYLPFLTLTHRTWSIKFSWGNEVNKPSPSFTLLWQSGFTYQQRVLQAPWIWLQFPLSRNLCQACEPLASIPPWAV